MLKRSMSLLLLLLLLLSLVVTLLLGAQSIFAKDIKKVTVKSITPVNTKSYKVTFSDGVTKTYSAILVPNKEIKVVFKYNNTTYGRSVKYIISSVNVTAKGSTNYTVKFSDGASKDHTLKTPL